MIPTSARGRRAIRAALLAGTFAIAAQAWSPTLMADVFSPTGDPDSAYFSGDVTPPSWQGRPTVIPENGGLALPEISRRETL